PNVSAQDMVAHRQQLVSDLERRLYEKHLQYCNTSVTIHWLSSTTCQLVLSKLRLYVYPVVTPGERPKTDSIAKTHDFLLATSVDIIELSVLLETSRRDLGNWNWVFRNNNQWNAIVFVLAELCVRPPGPDVDRAWLAITSTHNSWKSRDSQANKNWPAISRLMNRAIQARRRQLGLACGDESTLTLQYRRPFPMVGPRSSDTIDDPRQPQPGWSHTLSHSFAPLSTPNHTSNTLNAQSLPMNSFPSVPESRSGVDNRLGDLLENDFFASVDFPPKTVLDLF
ncbi:hypothetical protein AbraIFM66950_002089, partial [Aspergillus brasiliensis]